MNRKNETSQRPTGQQSISRKRSRDKTDGFNDAHRTIQSMETTFITIHDLTRDARILYCSQSITDVLDWRPEDVVGRSCWQFFHPEETPFARTVHGRGVKLDKASVLNYCRIINKYGEWVGCECVFTVVYNVLIGCTSIYLDGPKSKKRAIEAPVIRQLFSSSPRDPRYNMLSHISAKFRDGPKPHTHERRAALFLNRFTRTLPINFATNGLDDLLGISAEELQGNSFYYCIQSNCLGEAVRCLESAKANDSIAYLRFWYRDPRSENHERHDEILNVSRRSGSRNDDESETFADHADVIESRHDHDDDRSVHQLVNGYTDDTYDRNDIYGDDVNIIDDDDDDDDDEEGGVELNIHVNSDGSDSPKLTRSGLQDQEKASKGTPDGLSVTPEPGRGSQHSSAQNAGTVIDDSRNDSGNISDRSPSRLSSTPITDMSLDSPAPEITGRETEIITRDDGGGAAIHNIVCGDSRTQNIQQEPLELEAVISCTSDGLVVVIRAARPFVPSSVRVPSQRAVESFSNGLFASPWAREPVVPKLSSHFSYKRENLSSNKDFDQNFATSNDQALETEIPTTTQPTNSLSVLTSQPPQTSTGPMGGPPLFDFMRSIREVAVFAWALTGINGSLHDHSRGKALLGAIPHSGLPIYAPDDPSAVKDEDEENTTSQH